MNPFDWKTVLLARHAQHVVLIHFPIALFLVAVAVDLLALWAKKEFLSQVAYTNLTLAAASAVPTVLTGLAAWQWQLEGQRLKGILLYHLLAGSAAALSIWASWWLRFRRKRATASAASGKLALALELLGAAFLVVAGHLGGFLTGVNS